MDKKHDNSRPPIITIMGHVDHGKTTLLDAIRKTNVVAREHGGITQHIGAYQVESEGKKITFVDTPGHAAFEKMRSRGAEVADIVILVVAANDGVKPQTVEAIKHIQKAQKPTIVGITKTDFPDVNIDKVKNELQTNNIVLEQFGGDVPVVELSAPKGKGIDELLEVISLVWQMSPQESKPNDPLEAVVVESFMDKNRGPVVTVIVKKGTLKIGQKILVDNETVIVKALIDDLGKNVKEAEPGKPVEILGFKKPLDIGSVLTDENQTSAKETQAPLDLAAIIAKAQSMKENFKVIVKADVAGSQEAILLNLPENILVVASSVGEVTLNDVSLARVAQAPILAFNVKVPPQVKHQAENDGVLIREYKVIYELLQDIEDVALGFEEAKYQKKITGRANIVASFNIDGSKIAGAKVTSGKIKINEQVILRRGDKEIGKAKITSLKKFKKDIPAANNGQDCGIGLTPSLDFQIGDIIESLG